MARSSFGKPVWVIAAVAAVLVLGGALMWQWKANTGPARAAGNPEVTYWVWHRQGRLAGAEVRSLSAQGVRRLFWHAATLRGVGKEWRLEGNWQLPPREVEPAIAIVPVLRFSLEGTMPLGEEGSATVGVALAEALRRSGGTEIQVDFDCPDRRLREYAAFLGRCRASIAPARLSATALAGWAERPELALLSRNVDELFPMFYDLHPDTPAEVQAGFIRPLAGEAGMERLIGRWKACRVPWNAGLPNFARITIFDGDGKSRGHLRAWEWDEVCFNPALALRGEPAPGVVLFAVEHHTVLANTALLAGETVACRWPEPGELARAHGQALRAGAAGVALFRLPSAGSQGGWSLRQMETLLREGAAGEPLLQVRMAGQSLELFNESASDLPPRLTGPGGPGDRGWQLELDSSEGGAVFREARPGEFAQVFGKTVLGTRDSEPVPIPLADRLTFRFSDLRAGQSRQTGLLVLGGGADFRSLRWRVVNSLRSSEWQPVP
jgi:hypothetical protein